MSNQNVICIYFICITAPIVYLDRITRSVIYPTSILPAYLFHTPIPLTCSTDVLPVEGEHSQQRLLVLVLHLEGPLECLARTARLGTLVRGVHVVGGGDGAIWHLGRAEASLIAGLTFTNII